MNLRHGSLLVVCWMAVGLLGGGGCGRGVSGADEQELRHPVMRRARAEAEAGRRAEAVRLYRELLAKRPDMARAHLELALLLDDREGDVLEAMYHYRRYLELRPGTEKREMIRQRIAVAVAALGGGTTNGLAARVRALEEENAGLRIRVHNLQVQLARSRPRQEGGGARPADATLASVTAPALPMQPAVRMHRVEPGETLSRIASRVYGDAGRWREIFEANREVLRSPEDVRVGQVLVLP